MTGRKNGRMITRLLAWMLTLVVLCTSVPLDGIKVYAVEAEYLIGESSDAIEDNGIYGNQSDENDSIDNQEELETSEITEAEQDYI